MPSLFTKSPPDRNDKAVGCLCCGLVLTHVSYVRTLDHKVLDDPVEGDSLVALRDAILLVLPRAELPEVLCGLGADIGKELKEDPAQLGGSHLHVEEDHWVVRVPEGGGDLGPGGPGGGRGRGRHPRWKRRRRL